MNIKALTATLLLALSTTVSAMEYQHVRNATAKIHYGGKTFLVDPYLADKHENPGFPGAWNGEKRNPAVAMTQSKEDVIKGVDAVVLTHLHEDHWDKHAQRLLPKDIPVFVQNAGDARTVREQGFKDVRVVGKNTDFFGVKLSKTGTQHGTDEFYSQPQLAEMLGEVMGVVFQNPNEKTLYIVGDTLWNYHVDNALSQYQPDVIVMNTGDASLADGKGGMIMNRSDVAKMRETMPKADIVTVHMDALSNELVTSKMMREFVKAKGLKQVAVPKEGQVLKY